MEQKDNTDSAHGDNDDSKPPAVVGVVAGEIISNTSHDDEDDWSRQVETDETTAGRLLHEDSFRLTESVIVEGDAEDADENAPLQPHSQRELTMKEKLVMRERERRIETERARLKRQFVLNNEPATVAVAAASRDESVSETLGEESIVAHPDEESANEGRLGFNMERFLRNSDSFNPQLEPTKEGSELPDQNVLMKRFLNEPLVPSAAPAERSDVTRSVSFEMDSAAMISNPSRNVEEQSPACTHESPRALESFGELSATSVGANASIIVQADGDDIARNGSLLRTTSMDTQEATSDVASTSTAPASTDEPRVLRLTEADMQEMVAIEEASIGNAPPSEREEMLSEIGELADFSGGHLNAPDTAGNFSLDTPTTAMESGSLVSGNHLPQSDRDHASDDRRSLDGLAVPTLSTELLHSRAGSVEANPPSETAEQGESTPGLGDGNEIVDDRPALPGDTQPQLTEEIVGAARLTPQSANTEEHEEDDAAGQEALGGESDKDGRPVTPNEQTPLVVDGFDFDKHVPTSPPPVDNDDSYRALPLDEWSPGKMGISPLLPPRTRVSRPAEQSGISGRAIRDDDDISGLPMLPVPLMNEAGESEPLLPVVPPEIVTRRTAAEKKVENKTKSDKLPPLQSVTKADVSDVRSGDELAKQVGISKESEQDASKNPILARGTLSEPC